VSVPHYQARLRHQMFQYVFFQALFAASLGIAIGIVFNIEAAKSAFIGGSIAIVPNIYFAMKFSAVSGARLANKIINNFYRGEAMKIFLTAAMFAVVFKFLYVRPLPLFLAFISTQMAFWFAPLILKNRVKV